MRDVSPKLLQAVTVVVALAMYLPVAHAEPEGSHTTSHSEGSGTAGGEQDKMMAAWQAYAAPGEHHKVLDALAGNWKHTVTWWMAAGAPPEKSTGNSMIQWILGGRFLQHDVTGTAMGQPFAGLGITGYDNVRKTYNSIWLDDMGTGVMAGSGQYDKATKTLSDKGTFTCPFRGETPFRGKTTLTGADTFTYEMYGPGMDGKEFLNMRIEYVRDTDRP